MKKFMDFIRSPLATVLAFVLAAGLLLFSSVGGARAALTYFSETYSSRVQLFDIGVTLVENDEDISWRNYDDAANGDWEENTGVLVGKMLAEGEKLVLGKPYTEELTVRNSGSINQYVRVRIYKYWLTGGEKRQDLDPSLIDLHLVNIGTDWLEDESASTPERTVLYYNRMLPAGATAPLFADKLTIDGQIAFKTHEATAADGSTVVTYDYNGAEFCIEAKVDAIQENNADAAALSAWGEHITVDPEAGTLSLEEGGAQ